MNANNRSSRRRFPGAPLTPEEEGASLPAEPLPPERTAGEDPRPSENAPIVLVPVGTIDDTFLERASKSLEETFTRSTTVHRPLPVPKYAFNPTRGQYHSAAILKRVE